MTSVVLLVRDEVTYMSLSSTYMTIVKAIVARVIADVNDAHTLFAVRSWINGALTMSQKGEELAFPWPDP